MYHNLHILAKNKKYFQIMNSYLDTKYSIEEKFSKATSERDMRFYLLCLLALESGARVSDLLRLDWINIEYDTSQVIYINTKSKKRQFQKVSDGTISKIRRYKETLNAGGVFNQKIFYNSYKNTILSRVTANRRTQKEFGFNFHQLRKEAGRNIANQKGVVMASKYLGHSRTSTTDIYLGISDSEYRKQMTDTII